MKRALFSVPVIIQLSEQQLRKAQTFAEQVVHTVNYRDSNQTNRKKIEQDHCVSKLGEEAVAQCFFDLGLQVKGPDYTIYEGKAKSWEADLYVDDIEVAVKTQTQASAEKYGLSWTFQHSARRKDPILKVPLAWVCFVLLNENQATVYPPVQIKDINFKAPRLQHLRDKKKVVYASDLSTTNH